MRGVPVKLSDRARRATARLLYRLRWNWVARLAWRLYWPCGKDTRTYKCWRHATAPWSYCEAHR